MTPPSPLLTELSSEAVLEEAFAWLCDQRKDYSPHNEVWDVRWRWHTLKPELQHQLRTGTYRLSPVQRLHLPDDGCDPQK